MIQLTNRELVGVYLFLKRQEEELDPTLDGVIGRIEKYLYGHLSVEEVESLDVLYREGLDSL